MKRKSTSYVCTLDVNSVSDMEILQAIRKTVSVSNYRSPAKKRVVIRGRKPATKMLVVGNHFQKPSKNPMSYDWAGNIVGGIANATKYDVYVYDRREW